MGDNDNIQQLQLNAAGGNVQLTEFSISSNTGNVTSSIQATTVNIDGDINFKGSSSLNMDTLNVENMTLENTVFQNSFNLYGALTVHNIGAGGIFNDTLSFQNPENNAGITVQNIVNSLNFFKYKATTDGLVDINPKLLMKVDYDKESINIPVNVGIGTNDPTALLTIGDPNVSDINNKIIVAPGYSKTIHIGSWSDTQNEDYCRIQASTNLHIDPPDGGHTYLNWYSSGNTFIKNNLDVTGDVQCNSIYLDGRTYRNFYRGGSWIKYAHIDGIGAGGWRTQMARWYGIFCPYGDMFIDGFIFFGNHSYGSDIRIKKDIVEVNDTDYTDILKNVNIYRFNYVDPKKSLSENKYKTIGYIADNLYENIPEAVKEIDNFVPDELREIENPNFIKNGDKWLLQIDDIIFDEHHTGKCKFKCTDENDETIDDIVLIVEDDKKSFLFKKKWDDVFLYGKEVDNFKTVDNTQIIAMCHGAINNLSPKVSELENDNKLLKQENIIKTQEINELKTEINELKQKLQTMENDLAFIKQKLDI